MLMTTCTEFQKRGLAGGSAVRANRPTPSQGEGAQQPDEAPARAALCGAVHRLGPGLHVPLSPPGPGPGRPERP